MAREKRNKAKELKTSFGGRKVTPKPEPVKSKRQRRKVEAKVNGLIWGIDDKVPDFTFVNVNLQSRFQAKLRQDWRNTCAIDPAFARDVRLPTPDALTLPKIEKVAGCPCLFCNPPNTAERVARDKVIEEDRKRVGKWRAKLRAEDEHRAALEEALKDNPPPPIYPAYPSLYMRVLLEAQFRFGLRRRLGNGVSREGWLTKDYKVLKIPVENSDVYQGTQKPEHDQMDIELKAIKKGTCNLGKWPVAKGEGVTIQGIQCILMEYVLPREANEPEPKGLNRLPENTHRRAYLWPNRPRDKMYEKRGPLADGQWGYTPDGRAVVYDVGCEEA